jgi:abhydrolase domain-containing protein 6
MILVFLTVTLNSTRTHLKKRFDFQGAYRMNMNPIKAGTALLFAISVFWGCARFEGKLFNFALSVERQRSHLTLKTLRLDQQNIVYLEREGPGETIVLLHGFAANKDTWLRFVRCLPEQYRVLVVDLAGHGDRRQAMEMESPFDLDHMKADFSRVIDRLGEDHFHLAGNSLGGYVATFFARENPHKLITLGLFASAGVWSPKPSDFQLALEKESNPLLVDSPQGFDQLMDLVFYEKPWMPWPVRPVLERELIKKYDFYKKMWDDIWRSRKDVAAFLPEIKIPVFLLWGEKDRILDVSSVTVYQKYLSDVQTRIIEDCGHGLIVEKPEEAAKAYTKFLMNVETRKYGSQKLF